MEEVKKTKPRKGKKRKATDMPAKRPNKRTKVEPKQETEGNRKRKAKDQPNRRPKKKRKIETTISIESKKRKATKQPTTRPKKLRKIEKQETTVDNELRSIINALVEKQRKENQEQKTRRTNQENQGTRTHSCQRQQLS